MQKPIVIKFGGSLIKTGQEELLKSIGTIISQYSSHMPIYIVAGGGSFADLVRQYGDQYKLQDKTCHLMAISAMDQNAFLLQEVIPQSELRYLFHEQSLLELEQSLTKKPQLFVASGFLNSVSEDELPPSWDVTSDTLSLYIAKKFNASRLIIMKSTDVNPALQEPDVDGFLLKLLPSEMPIWFVNGHFPERLDHLFKKGVTKGVYIPPGSQHAVQYNENPSST